MEAGIKSKDAFFLHCTHRTRYSPDLVEKSTVNNRLDVDRDSLEAAE